LFAQVECDGDEQRHPGGNAQSGHQKKTDWPVRLQSVCYSLVRPDGLELAASSSLVQALD